MQVCADETLKLIKSIQLGWFYLQLLLIHVGKVMRVRQCIVNEVCQKVWVLGRPTDVGPITLLDWTVGFSFRQPCIYKRRVEICSVSIKTVSHLLLSM
jgi:hypothetical protein